MLGLTITLALFPPMTIKSPNSPVSADLSNVDIITTARITTMAEHEPEPSSPPAAVADHEKHNEGNTVSSPPQDDCSPSPPPVSSITGAGRRRQQLLAALKATDRTVDRFDRLISTAAGQERVLAVTGYLAHTLHHILSSAPWIAFQARLSLLARLRNNPKPPTTTTTTSSSSSSSKSPLLALSSLMSETRFTLRLLGLFPLWTWGSQTLKHPPADKPLYILTLLQVFVNVIYQALENVGYLAQKGIVSKRFVDRWGGIDKWYIWSTRAWFGHIFFQFFVLWRGTKREALRKEIRAWRKSLVNNVCWAPLCLHWCFEKGIGFPEHLTGLVSFMAGAWEVWDSWVATGL
ncbi:uncharacterized protein BO87DRAFT_136349 [Aspergillus neoniger CBS 115656]|uniref:25D9-5p n=1 Tax=Aspergillus neoniger (strain CBS 115656) TaxID=1448310 RepID=A0A318YTG1_ASPNB|nr:hypothetical protein BO87DRAFT_136349 [Aspergillus neoniger CBS 115656]PYH31228.1 hypothetical protein BO87DRAFT_136349 [Aspergillus neoniger CBS 115656]